MAVSITTKTGDATTAQADALIVPVGAGAAIGDSITKAFDGQLAGLLEATGFGGKRGEVVAYPTFGKLGARTLVLTALGERTAEPGRWGEALRRAYGAAVTRARDEGAKHIAVALPEFDRRDMLLRRGGLAGLVARVAVEREGQALDDRADRLGIRVFR